MIYEKLKENTASIYKNAKSKALNVMYLNQKILNNNEEVIIKYHDDGIQITRASISSTKKTVKIIDLCKNRGSISIKLGYKEGNHEIEVIDSDNIFIKVDLAI
jgi:hypothetical protein